MTKKSHARLMKDAMKKDQQENKVPSAIWDELNEVKVMCAQMLLQHTGIHALAQRKDLIALIQDKESLVANIKSMAADIAALNGELGEIGSLHEGKSGGSDNPDEVMVGFSIFEKYQLFMQRHDALIIPASMQILEQFTQAEVELDRRNKEAAPTQAEIAQSQASDPSHTDPIDVEFKEQPVN